MAITLKAARVNAGLTIEQAAPLIGVNKDTISRWENAKSFPNAIQIRKIEEAYNVNYNQIIFLPENSV